MHLAYNDLSQELEAMPDLFIRRNMKTRVDEIRAMLAGLCNTEINHCVIVPNVAHGITTVLRNFPWRENDKLIMGECITSIAIQPEVSQSNSQHNIPYNFTYCGMSNLPKPSPECDQVGAFISGLSRRHFGKLSQLHKDPKGP